MDNLSMSQLVFLMDTSRTHRSRHKNERDWMQTFCEDVVEPLFKSELPEHAPSALNSSPALPSPMTPPLPVLHPCLVLVPTIHRLLPQQDYEVRQQTNAPARTRWLSLSFAHKKSQERAESTGAIQDKALQRALTWRISMSRAWKGNNPVSDCGGKSTCSTLQTGQT
ncbi:hypothetical protein DFH29DRAFT_283317 [Suillus ampliporus]|nr:hypothetical protein DFH29DRAFT_283317 [Suillus ampliporus]